jgi:hypothetical protein
MGTHACVSGAWAHGAAACTISMLLYSDVGLRAPTPHLSHGLPPALEVLQLFAPRLAQV